MAANEYAEVDVSDWELLEIEPRGSKPNKEWLLQPRSTEPRADTQARWLFKPRTRQRHRSVTFPKGDDWAEKMAGEIARVLAIPSAVIELARRGSELGIISADVSAGRDLVLGNVVLSQREPSYPVGQRHGVTGYSCEAVFDALRGLDARSPERSPAGEGVCSTFAGYLVLDALIGNTDRHHENWGLLVGTAPDALPTLAATFDHASSLGFLLSDDERSQRLASADRHRTVEAYARRGRSRHFAGEPILVDLAVEAVNRCPDTLALAWIDRLSALDEETFDRIIVRIPEPRMSHPSRIFVARLLAENRRRLLDALDRAR